jgi:hypothetical protein
MKALLLAVILGLVIEEMSDLTSWVARRIVRWAARLWPDPQRSSELVEEWPVLIDECPGRLTKLFVALNFAMHAVARACWEAIRQRRPCRRLRSLSDRLAAMRTRLSRSCTTTAVRTANRPRGCLEDSLRAGMSAALGAGLSLGGLAGASTGVTMTFAAAAIAGTLAVLGARQLTMGADAGLVRQSGASHQITVLAAACAGLTAAVAAAADTGVGAALVVAVVAGIAASRTVSRFVAGRARLVRRFGGAGRFALGAVGVCLGWVVVQALLPAQTGPATALGATLTTLLREGVGSTLAVASVAAGLAVAIAEDDAGVFARTVSVIATIVRRMPGGRGER